ncbi:MAG: nucleotidyl transferase AbiEii/AbiGii toxin family protein [Coriobacteriales bacterium]|jgi:hypothetical protein|nr:nucleotidyl transferase AbiEii/AbiGii toxin family protein [Coriobacteriales bacterium]
MLPKGVVKGGSSLKMRYGNQATRFTRDLDTVRNQDLEEFLQKLEDALIVGWNGFTGRLVTKSPASPDGVPAPYVMQPFEIKLNYNGKPWSTVRLEVGHNEIGDAEEADLFISPEIVDMFTRIGLPEPAPIALMRIHHQIAQKIHGLTEPESKRVHDLIDLQIIMHVENVELGLVRETCERLFAYRRMQAWPPAISKNEGWDNYYFEQQPSASVLQTVDEAIIWGNALINRIVEAW